MATVNTMEIEGSQYEIEDAVARASIETLTTDLTAVTDDVAAIKAGAAYSSTEAIDTGVRWVNNKKIYRRVLTQNSPASGTRFKPSFSSDIDAIIHLDGWVDGSNNWCPRVNCWQNSNAFVFVNWNRSTKEFYFSSPESAYVGRPMTLILEYTSTQDQ